VCGYCGARYQTQPRPQPVARPVHVSPPVSPQPRAAPPKKSGAGRTLAALGVLVLLGGVVAGALTWQSQATPAAMSGGVVPPTTPGTNGALIVPPATSEPEVPASATFKFESRISGYQKSFYALGFVTNTSPFTIDKPKVTAVLVDKAGKELATRDGYAECDALPPKATAPIKILVSDPPAFEQMKFELVASKASYIPAQATDLRLEVLEKPHVTFGTSWEVTGKVFNDGKQKARFVNIHVLAFNAQDQLIGVDSTYVDGEALVPGASGRFRAMPLYEAAPHHFKFEVAGQASN